MRKAVVVCDTEPVAIEGLRSVLEWEGKLHLEGAETSLFTGIDLVRNLKPAVAVVDKGFGMLAVMDWLRSLQGSSTMAVVWGTAINEAEAVRLVQAGAMGVVRKTASVAQVLACLHAAAEGRTWTDQPIFRDGGRTMHGHHSALTSREMQVLELVEHGMRNKDIAHTLGIQSGTVKIHLKHIFEKTGIRGRYGLALCGLKEKGMLAQPTVV